MSYNVTASSVERKLPLKLVNIGLVLDINFFKVEIYNSLPW